MFDDDETPQEESKDVEGKAKEKFEELCMYSELAAVYEGPRKFDARLIAGLDAGRAREIQKNIVKLERSRSEASPLIPVESAADATALLQMWESGKLSTNDYHIHRRPGEVMMVRWLVGPEIDTFYERFQAHYDAAIAGHIEDEQSQSWKQDEKHDAYIKALESIKYTMADRYLRDPIKVHKIFILSTQTADKMNIAYITGDIMNVTESDLVGEASAPTDGASESDLAWFFKLFALRGMIGETETMCFFTYLQKTDDGF